MVKFIILRVLLLLMCLPWLFLFLSKMANSTPSIAKVAIVDTGLDLMDKRFTSLLCGAKDFTGEGIVDKIGHGTHVAGLIKQYAENSSYCLIILKYYSLRGENGLAFTTALQEAINMGASIINISGGGDNPAMLEYQIIKNNPNVIFVSAAGNDNKNLDKEVYYPASYNLFNILVVGSLNRNGFKASSSNYGSIVKKWEIGEDVVSAAPGGFQGVMSGTSVATAIATGKLIKRLYGINQ